jgi:NAD(P)-dependent dehydrogenase (short-subunit alcohol dehydrogenase family)
MEHAQGPMLSGRVALITGAGAALAGAVTDAFLRAGASVVAAGRSAPPPPAFEAADVAGRWMGVSADLAGEAGAGELVQATVARFGRLDILAHLVGAWSGGADVPETTPAAWDEAVAANLRTAFLMCRAVIPQMRSQGYGRILTFGSRTILRPARGQAAYSTAKAGVVALTQSVAEEEKDRGITANSLLPSVIDTPANRKAMPSADPSRWVRPDHLAGLMVMLASEAGAAITGAAIPVVGRL